MKNNWLETDAMECVAIGLMIMFICLGIGGCCYLVAKSDVEMEKSKQDQPK